MDDAVKNISESFRENLKVLMSERGETRSGLAASLNAEFPEANYTRNDPPRWLQAGLPSTRDSRHGKIVDMPRYITLVRIAKHYGLSVSELTGEIQNPGIGSVSRTAGSVASVIADALASSSGEAEDPTVVLSVMMDAARSERFRNTVTATASFIVRLLHERSIEAAAQKDLTDHFGEERLKVIRHFMSDPASFSDLSAADFSMLVDDAGYVEALLPEEKSPDSDYLKYLAMRAFSDLLDSI